MEERHGASRAFLFVHRLCGDESATRPGRAQLGRSLLYFSKTLMPTPESQPPSFARPGRVEGRPYKGIGDLS